MPLTEAVSPKFAMHFSGAVSTAVWRKWKLVVGLKWYDMAVEQPRAFACSGSFPVTRTA